MIENKLFSPVGFICLGISSVCLSDFSRSSAIRLIIYFFLCNVALSFVRWDQAHIGGVLSQRKRTAAADKNRDPDLQRYLRLSPD